MAAARLVGGEPPSAQEVALQAAYAAAAAATRVGPEECYNLCRNANRRPAAAAAAPLRLITLTRQTREAKQSRDGTDGPGRRSA